MKCVNKYEFIKLY